ncbi:hypothetical protein [Oryzihumus leptocrescens]|uniref:DUF3592 domain-containing protein n=1 Tax=Oryzihumus leptocrescens TaxID=297536 RepID=A0A542ZH68_9MICO|nr:hypothetical protein [Oryzihumus leptocrescens]TQL59722.1 hypothetical protein FB474_1088 [Oryzihumus leptocrescens]
MTEKSTWLPTSGTAPERSERPRGSLRFRYRLALVIAFHLVVAAGVWWALNPDLDSRSAAPGGLPVFPEIIAGLIFIAVSLNVSSRVPLWGAVAAFIVCVGALLGLVPAVESVYANTAMTRVEGATVVKTVEQDIGMQQVDYRLPDGKITRGYYIEESRSWSRIRSYRRAHPSWSWTSGMRGPFLSVPRGATLAVLVDPAGHAYARNADANGNHTTELIYLGTVGPAWLVVEATMASALLRRRSLAQKLGREADAEAGIPS